jgi:hypothetical protein
LGLGPSLSIVWKNVHIEFERGKRNLLMPNRWRNYYTKKDKRGERFFFEKKEIYISSN